MQLLLISCLAVTALAGTNRRGGTPEETGSTVVIAAANSDDPYYNQPGDKNRYGDIIDFHYVFAKKLMDEKLNVIVSCDRKTCYALKDKGLPSDILYRAGIGGIWMRDMSRAGKYSQAGYMFKPAYIKKHADAKFIQSTFDEAATNASMKFTPRYNYVIDAGNVVDNFKDKAVLTSRVLKENGKEYVKADIEEMEGILATQLKYKRVCIVPEIEGDTTGHADGMVSFMAENVLAYSIFEEGTKDINDKEVSVTMVERLKECFGDEVTYLPLPYKYPMKKGRGSAASFKFTTACGTHVNALYTGDHLVVPTFGDDDESRLDDGLTREADNDVLGKIEKAVKKVQPQTKIYTVPVPKRICMLGGNVRCLSYLVAGKNADSLIKFVEDESKCWDENDSTCLMKQIQEQGEQ